MAKVYFSPLSERHDASEVSTTAAKLLGHIVTKEGLQLRAKVPLKVHFGEHGNQTFLRPESYAGIIDFLKEKQVISANSWAPAIANTSSNRFKLYYDLSARSAYSR